MVERPSMKLRVLLAVLLVIFLGACRKDDSPNDQSATTAAPGLFGSATLINVCGVVLDEAGLPIEGATVTEGFGSLSTITDEHGAFWLQGITGYTGLGLVRVSKAGYFPGSRSFLPAGSLNNVRIKLLTRTLAGSVDGASGGEIQSLGASVTFVGGGFVRNGEPYTGAINVYMNRLDPESADFMDLMPGNMLALQVDQLRVLLSYGMVVVELTDPTGQSVELEQGTSAELRLSISPTQQSSAPSEIDLWSYLEDEGYWRHEGVATRQGDEYVGQVSHFSFWNYDIPADLIQLTGIVQVDGAPVSGAVVTVTSSSQGNGVDITGPDGVFGGYVPAGTQLSLSVSLSCSGGADVVVYNQEIGSLTSNTDLGVTEVSASNVTQILGAVVGCNGQPLAQGYVLVDSELIFADEGQFSFGSCTGLSITLIGIDAIEGASSSPLVLSLVGSIVEAGDLVACDQGGSGYLNQDLSYGSVTDVEGNEYATIIIGSQEWMAENLRTSSYSDGSSIANITNGSQWWTLTTGAWSWFENDGDYNFPYGKLYNWYAIADSRKVCPSGWHVPTEVEWQELESALGMPVNELNGTGYRGVTQSIGGAMKAITFWTEPNTGATNESGFAALPGGNRNADVGGFGTLGSYGHWWSASESVSQEAWMRMLDYSSSGVFRADVDIRDGHSVRCVRD